MTFAEEISNKLKDIWIPDIYLNTVRPLRTRSFELEIPEKENTVDIVHTLLGIQLRTGRRLIGCPDLATARYLRVFARLGCRKIAIPYDITKISTIADELESAWQRASLTLDSALKPEIPQTKGKKRAAAIRKIRSEIAVVGAGKAMPDFNKETRQRKHG